jgi:hypothetical protein
MPPFMYFVKFNLPEQSLKVHMFNRSNLNSLNSLNIFYPEKAPIKSFPFA